MTFLEEPHLSLEPRFIIFVLASIFIFNALFRNQMASADLQCLNKSPKSTCITNEAKVLLQMKRKESLATLKYINVAYFIVNRYRCLCSLNLIGCE